MKHELCTIDSIDDLQSLVDQLQLIQKVYSHVYENLTVDYRIWTTYGDEDIGSELVIYGDLRET